MEHPAATFTAGFGNLSHTSGNSERFRFEYVHSVKTSSSLRHSKARPAAYISSAVTAIVRSNSVSLRRMASVVATTDASIPLMALASPFPGIPTPSESWVK